MVRVDEETLKELGLEAGGSQRLTIDELDDVLGKIKDLQKRREAKKAENPQSNSLLYKVTTVPGTLIFHHLISNFFFFNTCKKKFRW